MRQSNIGFHNATLNTLLDLRNAVAERQEQLGTGKKFQRISDNPLASAQIIRISREVEINQQFDQAIIAGERHLAFEESILQQYVTDLSRLRDLALQAGNGTLTQQDRQSIALEMEQLSLGIQNLANTRNSEGQYIFSGFQGNQAPIVYDSVGRASYEGDQGLRYAQIGPNTQLVTNDSGFELFVNIPTSPGSYKTEDDPDNGSSAKISLGQITNAEALTEDLTEEYVVVFNTPDPSLNFDVYKASDMSTPISGMDDVPFTDGMPIEVAGVTFSIDGLPQAGDRFSLKPANRQSVFDSLKYYTNVLNNSTDEQAIEKATNVAVSNLGKALDVAHLTQSRIGARLALVESQKEVNANVIFRNQVVLSEIEDIDYTEVVTQVSSLQLSLEVAQASYVKVRDLNLFNFL